MPRRLLIAPPDPRTHDPTVAEDILAGFFVFAGKVVHAQGAIAFRDSAALSAMGEPAERLRLASPFACRRESDGTHECANAHQRFPALAAEQRRSRLGRPGRGATAHVLDQRLALPARRRGSRLLSSFHAGHRPTCPPSSRRLQGGFPVEERFLPAIAICALGALLRRQAEARCAARSGRCRGDQAMHPARMAVTSADRRARSSTSSSTSLPLRHLFLAKNEAPPRAPANDARPQPAAPCASCVSATVISACFTAWATCRPIRSPSSFATSKPPASRSSARRPPAMSAWRPARPRLLMDVGGPPPFAFSRSAHASALAFEFSDGPWRVVVNCGAPITGSSAAREAARHTAAHSTLVIADTSSCHFEARNARTELSARPSSIVRPRRRPCARRMRPERGLTAMHHGYARRFGLLHERGLALSPDGAIVHGLDALVDADPKRPAGAVPFALRFHLHPNVRATLESRGRRPSGSIFRAVFPGVSKSPVSGRCSRRASSMPRPTARGGPGRSSSRLNPPSRARSPGASRASGTRKSQTPPPVTAGVKPARERKPSSRRMNLQKVGLPPGPFRLASVVFPRFVISPLDPSLRIIGSWPPIFGA